MLHLFREARIVRVSRWSWILVVVFTSWIATRVAGPAVAHGSDVQPGLSPEQREQLGRGLRELNERLEKLRIGDGPKRNGQTDRVADAEVYAKGLSWALRHDTEFQPADVALMTKALERCRARLAAIEAGKAPWEEAKGRLVRGFVSVVDGSAQPYGVIVPAQYDRAKPMRLDVVLHGSSRPVGMSELRFMRRFEDADGAGGDAPDQDYLELHPLGRVENGYRWSGETDIFEAIVAACRNYAVDRDRIVLRGMSMGASGTWHLGLKHPDRFVALGPYCGYVDTHEFSKTPLPNFVVVGPLPPHQEKTLHMLDSVDYAANAGMVPAIACMGDKDVFFQAHVLMGRAMEQEGLAMVNLISPGTGHVIDPATHAEQMRRLGVIALKGLDQSPKHVRFVTWTLKYSRCHWLQVLGMEEHYARAELDARIADDGTIEVAEPRNVTRFAILPPVTGAAPLRARIGGAAIAVPPLPGDPRNRKIAFGKRDGRWTYLGELDELRLDGKRPGLQGPIDDAFTAPFLCVRGTGTAWNPAVQAWSEASLKRFAHEWNRYFRGELPVKDDTAVTPEDVRRCNLILFGDPGSNSWIAKVLPQLPIRWTREECAIGETKVDAADHAPALIQPSPLAPGRYVLLNSGHTFHEKELSTLNYLLFPRLGDWALVKLSGKVPQDPSEPVGEEVVRTGFFDEQWNVAEQHAGQ
jgi:poly(3-hydroxybutyrate) depolymerase